MPRQYCKPCIETPVDAEKGGKKSKGGDDARWQRLERAVKNGDMTQEQAKQKYREWEMAESKKAGADAKKGAKRKAFDEALRSAS